MTNARISRDRNASPSNAALPENQRTFGIWLRLVSEFVITPLSPGFDLDRYDRELRRPLPSKPHATAVQASSIGWNH